MKECIVIIPTYNEKENIGPMLEKVLEMDPVFEVLIVDDGSPDGTAEIVKHWRMNFPNRIHLLERKGKQGLGTAYIEGFKLALQEGYAYIFEMDCDFSHNPDDLLKLYEACKFKDVEMAIGSRYKTGINVVNWPMGRVLMSYYASAYVRIITRMPIRDTTAGFVCYRRHVLETINLDLIRFKGYAFQIEMKFRVWKAGFILEEIPIIFTDRTRGESKMSAGIFKEAIFGVIELTLSSWFKKFPHRKD